MIKVYGSEICRSCREFKALAVERGLTVEFVDITESTPNLRAFLQLRDNHPLFAEIRAAGRIGIPVFAKESGEITLDVNEALAWMGEMPVEERNSGCASCG